MRMTIAALFAGLLMLPAAAPALGLWLRRCGAGSHVRAVGGQEEADAQGRQEEKRKSRVFARGAGQVIAAGAAGRRRSGRIG